MRKPTSHPAAHGEGQLPRFCLLEAAVQQPAQEQLDRLWHNQPDRYYPIMPIIELRVPATKRRLRMQPTRTCSSLLKGKAEENDKDLFAMAIR